MNILSATWPVAAHEPPLLSDSRKLKEESFDLGSSRGGAAIYPLPQTVSQAEPRNLISRDPSGFVPSSPRPLTTRTADGVIPQVRVSTKLPTV